MNHKQIETREHIIGFKEEIAAAAAASSEDEFFTWFDEAKDKRAAFVNGAWDFMLHIGKPAAPFLTRSADKTALEIGHGGGRVLAAASRHFRKVIGLDIHDNNQKVEDELNRQGLHNYQLFQTDGKSIPLEDASVDFVYSLIVLLHVEKYHIFQMYLEETFRVLKPNGIAVLYFGRRTVFSDGRRSRFLYWFDRAIESILLGPLRARKGYEEYPAAVNWPNLIISLPHAKKVSRRIGFTVMDSMVSHKHVPDGLHLYGGQHGLVLWKDK